MQKEPVRDDSMSETVESQVHTEADDQESMIKDRERRLAEARSLNLLSNTFMTVALDDKQACQYVLRVVTGIPDLEVMEVRKQYRAAKIASKDAILDILAEDRAKRLYNLEIQRAETIDHAKRIRFYGAMIDSEYLAKGKKYNEMPEMHIVYLSETDLWKAGKTTYNVEKYFKGTDMKYEDGVHVLYVNAEVDDGTAAAELMKYFKDTDPQNMSHGALSERVHFLKCEEGGAEIMCKMSEKWVAEGRAEGIVEGRAEGIVEGRTEGEEKKAKEIVFNLARRGTTQENIADIVEMDLDVVQQWLEGMSTQTVN